MSNDIRRYDPDRDWFENAQPLTVTAVVGDQRVRPEDMDPEDHDGHGRSVQLTMPAPTGRVFTALTEAQVLDLMAILSKRLACADNFAATAPLDEYRVQPDGTKEVVEEW